MMRRAGYVVELVALAALLGGGAAHGTDATAGDAPKYTGSVLERSTLTGFNWGATRKELADKGFTFTSDVTQITQGVVGGGKNGEWVYGGRGDLTGTLDTQKAGLWPGGFLTVELEGNWNDSVNGKTGGLNPANSNQLFPLPSDNNVALPNLSFAQFLSHYAGVTAGKFQTVTTGDVNEFAHGKGDTQFLNLAFNINPVALVAPYSTLGAGVIGLPTKDPREAIVSFLVLSATGKASTDGFDDLNGAIFAGSGRVRTDFFGRTGHQLVGALYSNKSYTSIDQRIGFAIENRALAKQADTWAVFYNFDQFLYETDKSKGHGVGLFGRFGASEGNPNPSQYFYSIGLGGKGMIAGRDLDQCGIGYYYASVNNPEFQFPFTTRSFLRDEWGFEAYYNVALTPWLLLTPDIQVIGPSQKKRIVGGFLDREYIDTATILGVRLQVIL
jgi:porin